jgi:hypothetical protein
MEKIQLETIPPTPRAILSVKKITTLMTAGSRLFYPPGLRLRNGRLPSRVWCETSCPYDSVSQPASIQTLR